MNRSIRLALGAILTLVVVQSDALARGFGGFHGGGFHGGGYGGFSGGFGGYRGGFSSDRFGGYGGERFGGYGGDRLVVSTPRPAATAAIVASLPVGFDSGNLSGRDHGDLLNRSSLNSFLGLPTDGGMHAASGAYGAAVRRPTRLAPPRDGPEQPGMSCKDLAERP